MNGKRAKASRLVAYLLEDTRTLNQVARDRTLKGSRIDGKPRPIVRRALGLLSMDTTWLN